MIWRYDRRDAVVLTRASVITVLVLILSSILFAPPVLAEEYTTVEVDLTHSDFETPTDVLNVGGVYDPSVEILAYETWVKDYQSVGMEDPEGSYVGSFLAEGLFKFDYAPQEYNSWGGQHSFFVIAKNFQFTHEQIMSGSTKWTVRMPVLADCILPQSYSPLLDDYDFANDWNVTQPYMIDMMKGYPPRFAVWETSEPNTNVSFRYNGTSNVTFQNNELFYTTTPMFLNESGTFVAPDAFCDLFLDPHPEASRYYYHLDEHNNLYITEDYHNDLGVKGFTSNFHVINDRIYIEMNYPVRPEINYTMAFTCRLKSNPRVYLTEESIGGVQYTDMKVVELNEPERYSPSPSTYVPRDVFNAGDGHYLAPGITGVEMTTNRYNKSVPLDSGWNIVFEEGYGNGLFGVEKAVEPGDMLQFRPYVEETDDNDTLKHLSMMLPFICDETIHPDIFVTYGNTLSNLYDYTDNGYMNGKYRWFSTGAAIDDYDFDGVPNYEDEETIMTRYGVNWTLGPCDFFGENPYFYSRVDNIYDGYVDFDWDETDNNDSEEYLVIVNNTKPYYRPVTAFNASREIEIMNTTETLVVDLEVFNEGSFHCNITVMNHEQLITSDKIGPLGTYTYSGPATYIVFWRGDTLNHSIAGGWDMTYENMGAFDTFTDEYGNSVWCRNCLYLSYNLSFWTTNPSDFNWTVYDPGNDNLIPREEGQLHIRRIAGLAKNYFYREVWGGVGSPESVASMFLLDRDCLPILANYSKPYPWIPYRDPADIPGYPGMNFNFPLQGYDYFDAYDDMIAEACGVSIRVYDNYGTEYVRGQHYEMHVIWNAWHYEHYVILGFNVHNISGKRQIPLGTDLYVEIWTPPTYVAKPMFGFQYWDDDWEIYPEEPMYYDIDPDTDYMSTIERPVENCWYMRYVGDDRWNWSSFSPYSQSLCNLTVSWLYPGVSPTKMSDSNGINASDYILFSTRNTFLQDCNPQYPRVGHVPSYYDGDVYEEDGFLVYVIFREYANITFLCYDSSDTSMKHTEQTNKFFFIDGSGGEWLSTQGNEYLTDPVWRMTHVSNEYWVPTDESLWNDGLSVFKSVSWFFDRASSGEVFDLMDEARYTDTNSPIFWMMYPSIDAFYFSKYYCPAQSQVRDRTEVYYFSLYNSASLTDGEWTQVLVEPEYVWTSVPRFDTRISIGNYFITVQVPTGDVDVDVLSDMMSSTVRDILLGIGGDVISFLKGVGSLLVSMAGAIWNGLKTIYDGASEIPGLILGAFSKLFEYLRSFGEWVYQMLLNFVGFVKNLMEELLNFVDFCLQFVLFVFPFIGFMLVVNYYQTFLVKARIAMYNLRSMRGTGRRLQDD